MYVGFKPKHRDPNYPCLMQDSQGNVYLMRDGHEGTLVYKQPEAIMDDNLKSVGDHVLPMNGLRLRPFSGEITLGET